MLSLRELAFSYPGQALFTALSAEIGAGVTWVVGDDGSGKTTLLKLVAGSLPCVGRVAVDGIALEGRRPRPVAWCDPHDDADDALAVVAFLDRMRAGAPGFDAAVLDRHLDGFDLRPHLGKAVFQLSTGTRRKLALAASFAAGAPVTLLDDPVAALDASSVGHLMRTLAEADREPARAFVVTAYAVPPGWPAAKVLDLPPRRR